MDYNDELLSLSKDDFLRHKILASIKELLLTTTLHKLTVTAVCEHAGISRSSFYNQFTDLNDALDWEFGRLYYLALQQSPFQNDWRHDMAAQIVCIMNKMLEESTVFKRIGKGMSLTDYNSIFQRTCRRTVKLLLSTIQLRRGENADERCVSQIEFFVRGKSFTIANWMISMKESPESIAQMIVDCTPAYLASVLDAGFAEYHSTEENGEQSFI